MSFSLPELEDLKRRHARYVRERLAGDEARADWRALALRAWDELRSLRLGDALDPERTARTVIGVLDAGSMRRFLAPLLGEVHREVVATLKRDSTALGEYVPADARRAIDSLLERNDLVPDPLVREVLGQAVVGEAIQSTLYDALTQFQTTVNPFFADWGLPAILRRMPIGGSMILSSMEAMRAEFDRRVEPEIRKFLDAFSRRTQGELADLFLSRSGDPKLVALRKDMARFLYMRSLEELLSGLDADTIDSSAGIAEAIVARVVARKETEDTLRGALERFVRERGDRTVGEWLDEIGAATPDLEAWAEASWPLARAVLASEAVLEMLERITSDFYDSVAGENAPATRGKARA